MLFRKIKNKSVKIGIIGIGYVGLPLAISLSEKKYKNVIGIDKNKEIIKKIKKNQSHISHIENKKIIKLNKNNFFITDNFSIVKSLDVIIVCLPTPLKSDLSPDMSYIRKCMSQINKHLTFNQLLILESTVYPGATDEIIINPLKKKFIIGKNFYIAYSPEREDPGNKKFSSKNITKLVSGHSKLCLQLAKKIYSSVFQNICSMKNIKTCEMTKLYENIYRSVNIGMVNEMKILCNKMNLNIYDIIEAAKTKPFGFHPFYPGPGLGGHCIPIDPLFLTWVAKKYRAKTKFISLSNKINRNMPNYIFENLLKLKKLLKFKKVHILGIAYKKNIDDMRESPSIELIKKMIKKKINFSYSDPYIKKFKLNKKTFKSLKLTHKKIDLSIVMTDHDKFNYKKINKLSKYIIDCRGRFVSDQKRIFYL